MKKLIALLLALVMVTCMATVAFGADGAATTDDHSNINTHPSQPSTPSLADKLCKKGVIPKTYQINSGTAPAETFTFKFEAESYKDNEGKAETVTIPAIPNQTISFDAISETDSKTVEFEINPDLYELGVYTYKVTEVKPTTLTPGVTYSEEELYLVLTILRDEDSNKHYVAAMHYQDAATGDKAKGFTNQYDSGSLTISKNITGNMADMDKEFEFTVVFTLPSAVPADHVIEVKQNGVDATDLTIATNSKTITGTYNLGDDDNVSFSNLPVGCTYTIVEDEGEYTQYAEITNTEDTKTLDGTVDVSGKITAAGEADTADFTNELRSVVDTGIALDSAPYIVMLVVAMAGVVALVSKKRYEV